MANTALGVLSYVGMALVFGALAVRFLAPQWDQYAVYAAWAGLALVLAYTVGQWREIVAYFRHRNARYGALASASVVIVLGILVALNYLSNRRNWRWDLTENRQYSLSDQTVRILESLDAPVRVLVFDESGSLDQFRPRLTEYAYHSDQVAVEYIDADRQPVLAREYEIETYGTVVLEYMGRTERVESTGGVPSEQDLTNGLIKVVTGEERRVYFVQGHGERDPEDSERGGYSSIAAALGRDNYGVETLVLAQQQEVPDDAAVVVLAGPRVDLLQPEADMLDRHLRRGGHLLVMFDPPEPETPAMPVLDAFLRDWAVDPGENIVVDVSGIGQLFGTDISSPVAQSYPAHPITERFAFMTAYPLARSVDAGTSEVAGRTAQSIIQTGPQSWAESDIAGIHATGEVELQENTADRPGPISIGVAVTAAVADVEDAGTGEETEEEAADADADAAGDDEAEPASPPESRLVVLGDSDFAANYALGIQGNRDLFMNSVSWLAQQENLIAIRPREASDRRLAMTARSMTGMFWVSVFVIPLGVFAAGVFTWWRRRS